ASHTATRRMEGSRTYAPPMERPGRISATTCRQHCRENSPWHLVVLASQHKVGGTLGLRQAVRRLPGSWPPETEATPGTRITLLWQARLAEVPSPSTSVTPSMAS